MLAGPRAPCPSPPRGASAPTGTARAVPSAERTETHRVAAGENRPRPPRPPSAPTSPARVAWAVPGGLRPVHLRTRLRSVQRPQKVEAGLARGRRLLCRVRSAKARARPLVGGPSPPELVSPSQGACHAPFADDAALLPCPRACPRRLWRVPSCLRLRLAGERAWRFPVRAAAVTVTPGSGVGPPGRKSVPAGPALRAPTTQSPRSSV